MQQIYSTWLVHNFRKMYNRFTKFLIKASNKRYEYMDFWFKTYTKTFIVIMQTKKYKRISMNYLPFYPAENLLLGKSGRLNIWNM